MKQGDNLQQKVIVFVHGMYGSNLVDDTHTNNRHVWISPSTILKACLSRDGFSDTASPLTWSGTRQDKDGIQATSIVTLNCRPWWNWTESLRQSGQVDVLNFIWDWRRPLEETCHNFLNWLQSLLSEHRQRALLVTYSTGSLFGWVGLNTYPELFEGWVSVGGAVGCGNFMLHDHEHGWSKGPVRIFRPETSFSFASSYGFFPVVGEPGYKESFTDMKSKQGVEIDLLDHSEWKRNEIGIYGVAKRQGREVTEQEEIHLQNSLDATKRFRTEHFYREGAPSFDDERFLIHPKEKYSHLNIVMYGSTAFDTTHKGWLCDDDLKIRMEKGPVLGVGDGTVLTWAWNFVPGGLPFKTILTETVHIQLLTDSALIQVVAEILGIKNIPCSKKKSLYHSRCIGMVVAGGMWTLALALLLSGV